MKTKPTKYIVSRTAKKRATFWIDRELVKKLQQESGERNVAQCRILETCLRERYATEIQEEKDALIARRLSRIDTRLKVIEQQEEILAETFELFIRSWLACTPEVPESNRDAAYEQATMRYERFLQSLSKRIKMGQGLLVDLQKDIYLSQEDFKQDEG